MRPLRHVLLYLALWSPVALGFAFALALTESLTWPQALGAGVFSTMPGAMLGLAAIALCGRLPWRGTPPAAFVGVHTFAALAYSALWGGAIVTAMWVWAPRAEVHKFLRSDLAWQLIMGMIVYALLIGVTYARGALRREEQQARAIERAEMLRLRAELSALRARLDPHFLFNVLQTLGALVSDAPAKAHVALECLAGLLKRRIDSADDASDTVPLLYELTDAREYLALETLRFGSRLVTSEEIDPATLPLTVPRFTLQPLVENAVRHGLASRATGGHLTIRTQANHDSWTLSVSDDGAGADPARFASRTGVGISVLRERLRLGFGEGAAFRVDTAPGAGCTVTVSLPIEPDDTT